MSPKRYGHTKKYFVATWQKTTAGLRLQAGQPFVLLFQDEARFGRISEARRRCWAPFPQRPHAARQVVRQYVYAAAAVSPLDGRLCSLVLPWMNAQTMSLFLRHAARSFATERCVMFLDQAGWHLATELHVPRRIHLCSLPAHSPERESAREPLETHPPELLRAGCTRLVAGGRRATVSGVSGARPATGGRQISLRLLLDPGDLNPSLTA
jgi:hypothetical protein